MPDRQQHHRDRARAEAAVDNVTDNNHAALRTLADSNATGDERRTAMQHLIDATQLEVIRNKDGSSTVQGTPVPMDQQQLQAAMDESLKRIMLLVDEYCQRAVDLRAQGKQDSEVMHLMTKDVLIDPRTGPREGIATLAAALVLRMAQDHPAQPGQREEQ